MNLPDKCPFCGSFAELRNGEKWVGYTCITTIHAGHDARRMQSITCAGLERTRLLARVAELESENKAMRKRAELADGDVKKAQAILDASNTYIRRIEVELQRESQAKIDAEFHVSALKERVAELEARCKRLEEIGDMIVDEYMVVEPEKSAWQQAKEAKP